MIIKNVSMVHCKKKNSVIITQVYVIISKIIVECDMLNVNDRLMIKQQLQLNTENMYTNLIS